MSNHRPMSEAGGGPDVRHDEPSAGVPACRAPVMQYTLGKELQAHRVALDLHNRVGQLLTAALLNLEYWSGSPVPADECAAIAAEVREALTIVRDLSLETRSRVLDAGGLIPALERYLVASSEAARLRVHFHPIALTVPLAEEVALFRILRELIDNVTRHASATTLTLRMDLVERCLEVALSDDGVGFDQARALQDQPEGGLVEIRTFVQLLGGTLQVDSEPDTGVRIRMLLPMIQSTL